MVRATVFRLSVKEPRRHQTAIRSQADACSHATTALLPLSQGRNGNVAPQKPLRATGRPSKSASSIPAGERFSRREHSPRNRDRSELVIDNATHRLSSTSALQVGSLGWTRHVRKPRSPARRPIQADEVEPMPQRSPGGIASQMLTPRLRSLFGASVRRPARHAATQQNRTPGKRVSQTAILPKASRSSEALAHENEKGSLESPRHQC